VRSTSYNGKAKKKTCEAPTNGKAQTNGVAQLTKENGNIISI